MPTSPTTFKIAIVEDIPVFGESLCKVLANDPQFEVLPPCRELHAALALLEHTCPDVLLVDLGLPTGRGELAIHFARHHYGAHCTSAVLTVTGNVDDLLGAVGAGAKGYLLKDSSHAQWLDTVHMFTQGQSELEPSMAWRFLQCAHAPAGEAQKVNLPVTFSPLTRSILQSIAAGHTLAETATHLQLPLPTLRQHLRAAYDQFALPRVLLTQREVQTLRFLNQGLLYKECAVAMGISEVTVKSHMQNAGDKLLPEKSGSHSVPKTLFAARAQGILV